MDQASGSTQNKGIFNPFDERISLVMVPIMLAICGLGYVTQTRLSADQLTFAYVLVFLVFMNTTHAGLTFVMLLKVPEFRRYLAQQKSPFMNRNVLGAIGLVLVAFTLCLLAKHVSPKSWLAVQIVWIPAILMQFPLDFWGGWHIRRQMMGLTLLYNRNVLVDEGTPAEQKQAVRKFEKLEKIAFACFSYGLVFRLILYPIQKKFHFLQPLTNVALAAEFGLCFWLLWLASKMVGPNRNFKMVFLLRTFLLPLAAIHIFFYFALRSIHGIEYFFLTRKMLDRTEMAKKRAREVMIFGLLLGASMVIPNFIFYMVPGLPKLIFGETVPLWPVIFIALSRAGLLMHYHIDGFIFRFHDPVVRENVGPLVFDLPMTAESMAAVELQAS